MTEQTITQAIATQAKVVGPGKFIDQYRADFAQVLPSHVSADTWMRVAQGALRRGKIVEAASDKNPMHPWHGRYLLEAAAMSNPPALLVALLDAARQGLEPGTENYYLTPRQIKGRWEILGITGYQGYIELMYRSGAVESVIAEAVYANDTYSYVRGRDKLPVHEFDPWASKAERGEMKGVYAYAMLTSGGVSRVIEMSMGDVAAIRAQSPSASAAFSPWQSHFEAMALKCPVRQLRKWVPTTAEWTARLLEARAAVQGVSERLGLPPAPVEDDVDVIEGTVEDETGGAAVDDPPWPDTTQPPTS